MLSGIYDWHLDTLKNELKQRKKKIATIVAKLERILKGGGSIIVVETTPESIRKHKMFPGSRR